MVSIVKDKEWRKEVKKNMYAMITQNFVKNELYIRHGTIFFREWDTLRLPQNMQNK